MALTVACESWSLVLEYDLTGGYSNLGARGAVLESPRVEFGYSIWCYTVCEGLMRNILPPRNRTPEHLPTTPEVQSSLARWLAKK